MTTDRHGVITDCNEKFVAVSGSDYPYGMAFRTWDDTGSATKEMVISKCPHDFAPVGNQAACRSVGIVTPAITTSYSLVASRCNLVVGEVYNINYRPVADVTMNAQVGAAQATPCYGAFGC